MEDRIKQLLDEEQLSASAFAEMIGVQRSNLSHIINGRNKPSYDFIMKTIRHFPKMNIEWFLTGKGSIYKKEREPDLFQQSSHKTEELKREKVDETIKYDVSSEDNEIQPSENQYKTLENSKKQVDKIIIFFSDGSYEEYNSSMKV